MARRNPAPLSGALFVRNPRRNRRRNRRTNGFSAYRMNSRRNSRVRNRRRNWRRNRRWNPLALQSNRRSVKSLLARIRKKARKNSRRKNFRRRNALRFAKTNSRRRNYRRRNTSRLRNRRRNSRVRNRRRNWRRNYAKMTGKGGGFRKNRRSNKRRNYGRRRNYGYSMKRNRRRNARRNRRYNRRYNKGIPGTAMLTRLVGTKGGMLGGKVAPFITPAATAALSFVPVHYALKYTGQYIPDAVKPFAYTLSGLGIALISAYLPKQITNRFKAVLGVTAVTAGAVADTMRAFAGTSQTLGELDEIYGDYDYDYLGDGGAYDVIPYSGLGVGMGEAAVLGDYSDAVMLDAYYSGDDLSALEGETALLGAGQWRAQFKRPAVTAKRSYQHQSRHAGRPGHRWGWLIKLVGWENFRKIAAMPAAQRQGLVQKLRADAVASVEAASGGTAGFGGLAAQVGPADIGGIAASGLDMSGLHGQIFAGAAY
jgi:hypothetical protein